MKRTMHRILSLCVVVIVTALPAVFAAAQTPPAAPTTQAIKTVLDHVFKRIDAASTPRLLDTRTRTPVTQVVAGSPVAIDAPNSAGPRGAFAPTAYPYAIIENGMLEVAATTGDAKYSDFTARWFTLIHDMAPQTATAGGADPFVRFNAPRSMDDCGAISEAMMKAHAANVGPDMKTFIDRGIAWISTRQVRSPDGNLDRNSPLPNTIWADDFYMGGAPLAWAGQYTGDKKYWDDDIKQVGLFVDHLYSKTDHLYTHGHALGVAGAPPKYYWGRANGWCAMSLAELLTVLPDDYAGRPAVLAQYQDFMKGIAGYQAPDGRWRQVLDHPEAWEETSCSAMFVYAISRGINKGWLDAATFGPVVVKGWAGLTTCIDADGHVTGTVAGTNLNFNTGINNYLNAKPADDVHGYGPVLLAGGEVYKLIDSGKLTAGK
jgi:unsaturated rhamnogalacturonyl hydrolase